MSYKSPDQTGDLVVINQWNGLISKFDYSNRLLEVDISYELNSYENSMAIFQNIYTASLPNEPEIKVKVNIKGTILRNSVKDLKAFVEDNFDENKFINKAEIIDKIDNLLDEKSEAKRIYNRIKNFLKSADPRKRLEEFHFDTNKSNHSLLMIMGLSLDKIKMIDLFIPKNVHYYDQISRMVKELNEDNKIEKINYIYNHLQEGLFKEKFIADDYFRECLGTYKLKDLV